MTKPLAGLIIIKWENKSRVSWVEQGISWQSLTFLKSIIKGNYKQLYTHILKNLEGMDKFLKNHKLPKLNQDEIAL